MNAEVRCGPKTSSEFNETTIHRAKKCVFEDFHSYYDGCTEVCVEDRYLLPLFHHQHLEQVVYGQVRGNLVLDSRERSRPKSLIFPTLVVFAVLANVAVALVLSKKNMVSPTNVVLKYMAIAELLVGIVPLPWTIFFYTMG
ncbi:hypothetical protein ANCDUO_00051 [Ancylostoma duodenale]|uniref:G-protein coupled receptors family 1 profile domain-containing protein n=1 Tax=Ancylostoma duodenale TaxID=51022 RepID=A0A0C2E2E2_9BILA|nr:hypothetical protein ANCDUO_00051 [Ancylostoma duodenale]